MSNNEWQIFDSTAVAAGRYDKIEQVLELQFDSGKIYKYYDVPQSIWLALCRSESKGTFFRNQISERFRYELIGQSDSDYTEDDSESSEEVLNNDEENEPVTIMRRNVGTTPDNPFKTCCIWLTEEFVNGLYFNTQDGYAHKLIHEVVSYTDDSILHLKLYRKKEVKLPKITFKDPDKKSIFHNYMAACKGDFVTDLYIDWFVSRADCDTEGSLPDFLIWAKGDKKYNDILSNNDEMFKMQFLPDTYQEWPNETDTFNYPELWSNGKIRPELKIIHHKRKYYTFISPADQVDDYTDSSKRAEPIDDETLEKIRSLDLKKVYEPPKSGCASLLVIVALTVASLYFI